LQAQRLFRPRHSEKTEAAGSQKASLRLSRMGYTRPADGGSRYTMGREEHVAVDGKIADAVPGDFNGECKIVVALEGKGPRDPLDRPFAGHRMSAVDQG
jgi:hypothetical protein